MSIHFFCCLVFWFQYKVTNNKYCSKHKSNPQDNWCNSTRMPQVLCWTCSETFWGRLCVHFDWFHMFHESKNWNHVWFNCCNTNLKNKMKTNKLNALSIMSIKAHSNLHSTDVRHITISSYTGLEKNSTLYLHEKLWLMVCRVNGCHTWNFHKCLTISRHVKLPACTNCWLSFVYEMCHG